MARAVVCGEEEDVRKKERRVRRCRIFIQPPELVD